MKGSILTLCFASVGILPAVALPQHDPSEVKASILTERDPSPCGPPSRLRRWAEAMNPCNLLERDENRQSCHGGNRERCSCGGGGGDKKSGNGRLLKRVVCTLCRLPKIVDVPINRGCPLVPQAPEPEPTIGCPVGAIFSTTPAPTSGGPASATATSSTTTMGILPELTRSAIPFVAPSGWSLSAPEDSNYIFASRNPQPTPTGGARLARNAVYYPPEPAGAELLNDVLAGREDEDECGRVPVVYQADFDNYGVSPLEMADFWINNPNGMRTVRLKQVSTKNPEFKYLNHFAWGKADSRAANNTYYAEAYPQSVFPPSFGVVLCGQNEQIPEQARAKADPKFRPVNATLWAIATNAGLELLLNNTDFQRTRTFNHKTLDFCELFFGVPV